MLKNKKLKRKQVLKEMQKILIESMLVNLKTVNPHEFQGFLDELYLEAPPGATGVELPSGFLFFELLGKEGFRWGPSA